jgi:tetratricopeptide (TPR) repeat protein
MTMAIRQATRRFETITDFLAVWKRELRGGALALPPQENDEEVAPNVRVDLVLPIVGRLGPIPCQVVSRGGDGSTYLKVPGLPDEVKQGIDRLLGMVDEITQYLLDSGQHVPRKIVEDAVRQAVEAAQQQAQQELRQLRKELAERPAVGAAPGEAAVVTSVRPGERGFVVPDVSDLEPVFEGGLGDRSLRDAMVQLALHRATGLLVVFTDDGVRRFGFWERGGPVGFRIEPIDQRSVLGVLLYRAGKVDKAQLKQSLTIMEEQNIRQGEALIQLGVLNFPQLVMALQKQVELHLQKIMRIDAGVWAFFALDQLPERFVTPPLNVPSILFRALLNYSRQLSMDQIAEAHRPNMDRYVYFAEGVAEAAAEINFKASERKFLEIMAGNSWRLRELFSVSNLSRTDTSAVVWALNEMGFLDWRTQETDERYIGRVSHRIAQKTRQLTKGSLFDILEVHWICLQPEIDAALKRIHAEFVGRDYQRLPEELQKKVERILEEVDKAHATLSDERQRRTLRQELIEKDMIQASADILAKKGEMAVLKGDSRAALDCWGKAVELLPNNGAYRDGLNRARGL